jgi:hypothetical protein
VTLDRGLLALDRTLAERMEAFTSYCPVSGCWFWLGHVNTAGYAQIRVDYRNLMAHRVSYETHRGPIPEGLVLDHLCRQKTCINPFEAMS